MSKLSIFLFASLMITATHEKNIGGRIVGGEPTTIENYPYQVSIIYLDSHYCGGSIISAYHILTAAHCTDGFPAGTLFVRAGSTILNDGGQFIGVENIFQHPNFDNETYDYDISVLRLKSSLTFGSGVQPIALPSQSDAEVPEDIAATATGWGRLSENGSVPLELQKVILPTIAANICEFIYRSRFTTRMFCAGYSQGGKDTCKGDSGGPLAYNGVLLGVTSWGEGCGAVTRPGVYAKVSYFRNLIDQQINT